MAVRYQGARAVPTSDSAGQSARAAAGRLSTLASGIDEVARTLKRDGASNPQLAALSAEVDAARQQLANVARKLQQVR